MSTRKRRSRRGWDKPGDDLVSIVPDRVLAALEAHGMSASELAERIGDSQQTVSLICTGKTRRTRRARVERMAAEFDLPAEWLTGSMKVLPGNTEMWNSAHLRADRSDVDHPAAWQLAISKWNAQVERAYSRDQRGGPEKRPEQFLRERFALTFLIHPGVWRDLFFDSPDWRKLDETEDPLDEDTQVQLVNFMLDSLRPWLDGKAKLNYRNLLYIFGDVANHAIEALKTDPGWKRRLS